MQDYANQNTLMLSELELNEIKEEAHELRDKGTRNITWKTLVPTL